MYRLYILVAAVGGGGSRLSSLVSHVRAPQTTEPLYTMYLNVHLKAYNCARDACINHVLIERA